MGIDRSTLTEKWTLTPTDRKRVMAKDKPNRLDFGIMILFYRLHGRFPDTIKEINHGAVEYLAQQIERTGATLHELNTADRTWKRYRAEIRTLFGYRKATVNDSQKLSVWLTDQVASAGGISDNLTTLFYSRCRELSIEPPSPDRVNRIVRSAISTHDECLALQKNLWVVKGSGKFPSD